jgi:hypothetical protein
MGLKKLPPNVVDFYRPEIDHPLLIPSLADTNLFYKAIDLARSHDFPHDRILVLAFVDPHETFGWGWIGPYLRFLHDQKFTVLSIGDLAGYVDAGDAMRSKRYWDMRYAESGPSSVFFTFDRFSRHWYMDWAIHPEEEPAAASDPPEPPHAPSPLETQLDTEILPKLDFDGIPLQSCIDFLRQQPGEAQGNLPPLNFVLAGGVDASTPITLHLVDVPLMEVVRYLADLASATLESDRYAITLSPEAAGTARPTAKTPASLLQITALDNLILPEIDLKAATLGTALEALRSQAQSASTTRIPDFVIEPGVDLSIPVTLHLIGAPYTEALRYVSRLAGVGFSIDRYAISVTPTANPGGEISQVTPASLTEMADLETANIASLSFTDASLDSVMELLSQKLLLASGGTTRLTFVAEPGLNVSVPVTLHVENIPFTEALRYVGQLADVHFVIERYAISVRHRVAPAAEPTPEPYAAPTPFALVQ